MSVIHQLLMPGTVLYGGGAFDEVGAQARLHGTRALIVSDPIIEKIGKTEACGQRLQVMAMPYVMYNNVDAEPTDVHVRDALALCRREGCDVIIAVGGGSCIDTAKAVAVLMTNEGDIRDYARNRKRFAHRPIPIIAVPTTAGTGSEVTKVTVIIDTGSDIKMMLADPMLLPAVAIVDPELTISCPPNVTAATGIDALCHAIEAYISRRSQPVTDLYAFEAIRLITGHLLQAYRQGDDLSARSQVALGSMMAGAAFSNASVTLVHGMSRPIGALFHVPHGVSNAMLLPAVLEYTRLNAERRLAEAATAMDPALTSLTEGERADAAIRIVKQLCAMLNIPNMKSWGIDRRKFEQSLGKMAKDALDSGSPGNNPRIPTVEEIEELYRICYDYELEK